MGGGFSRLFGKLFAKKETRILMVGLAAAGKTTILNKITAGKFVTTSPATGFTVESVDFTNLHITVFDVGGDNNKFRDEWRNLFPNTNALIFVADSNDRERMDEAKEELMKMLSEDELRDAVLLVMCNKQDIPNAMSTNEITFSLGLEGVQNRQWQVQATYATVGDGLVEGFDWIASVLNTKM